MSDTTTGESLIGRYELDDATQADRRRELVSMETLDTVEWRPDPRQALAPAAIIALAELMHGIVSKRNVTLREIRVDLTLDNALRVLGAPDIDTNALHDRRDILVELTNNALRNLGATAIQL